MIVVFSGNINLVITCRYSFISLNHQCFFSPGILYFTAQQQLANAVENIADFYNFSETQLMELDDVGIKVAKSIYTFFHDKENEELIKELEKLGVQMKNEKKNFITSGSLLGQTFLFTGTLLQLKRSDAEAMVEKNGGKIVSGVSSKLNYLVVGDDAGSKLEKAKKINTVKIISEEEFLKMLPPLTK